jgi:adenylylsulfate kinase
MTGISGSGKTTIANAVAEKLRNSVAVDVIDGDETRKTIGELFGHSKTERLKMAKVNQTLGKYLLRNKVNMILAVVAPFEEIRTQFRKFFGEAYVEVYVKASFKTCLERDVKGLYKKANDGKLENFNGINDTFEVPLNSDIVVDTETQTVDECAEKIIVELCELCFMERICDD